MVTKTFKCPKCKKTFDIEMSMNTTKAKCPKCCVDMDRVFSNIQINRPKADGKGFYGVGK